MNLPPHRFHDALAFARFVVTEGASTAAEAACLGVPSIYVNSTSRGYLDDMRDRYGLVSTHFDSRSALRQVTYWLREPPDAAALATARGRLIDEHIDVTDYIVREVNDLMR
jgi:predicted glycosyltransferase